MNSTKNAKSNRTGRSYRATTPKRRGTQPESDGWRT